MDKDKEIEILCNAIDAMIEINPYMEISHEIENWSRENFVSRVRMMDNNYQIDIDNIIAFWHGYNYI